MTRKPRKYVPGTRELTPEWLEWNEAVASAQIDIMGQGASMTYFPEEYDRAIPEEGCWIRVLSEPHTELMGRFRVPILSMWRARPQAMNAGAVRSHRPQMAVIRTPGGDLHLYPHEYVLVPDISEWIGQEPDCVMHNLGGTPALDADQEEQLFYLQKAGIERAEAIVLMLPALQQQDLAYFTLHEAYIDIFGGVGVPLWQHIAESPRRSALYTG